MANATSITVTELVPGAVNIFRRPTCLILAKAQLLCRRM
jgi:hypothetical protein